jgi:hypothetical protein
MTPASEKFLADIRNDNADVRYGAWSRAGEMDPEVIPALGKLLVAEPPGVSKAAGEGLKNIVHSVGKTVGGSKRAAVVRQLIALTADGQPVWVRTVALRHLSLIGGDETVPAAAKLLHNAELQEEAAFCLERIPGKRFHGGAHERATGSGRRVQTENPRGSGTSRRRGGRRRVRCGGRLEEHGHRIGRYEGDGAHRQETGGRAQAAEL